MIKVVSTCRLHLMENSVHESQIQTKSRNKPCIGAYNLACRLPVFLLLIENTKAQLRHKTTRNLFASKQASCSLTQIMLLERI